MHYARVSQHENQVQEAKKLPKWKRLLPLWKQLSYGKRQTSNEPSSDDSSPKDSIQIDDEHSAEPLSKADDPENDSTRPTSDDADFDTAASESNAPQYPALVTNNSEELDPVAFKFSSRILERAPEDISSDAAPDNWQNFPLKRIFGTVSLDDQGGSSALYGSSKTPKQTRDNHLQLAQVTQTTGSNTIIAHSVNNYDGKPQLLRDSSSFLDLKSKISLADHEAAVGSYQKCLLSIDEVLKNTTSLSITERKAINVDCKRLLKKVSLRDITAARYMAEMWQSNARTPPKAIRAAHEITYGILRHDPECMYQISVLLERGGNISRSLHYLKVCAIA